MRVVLRVLIVVTLVLTFSLSTVAVVQVDAAPAFHRADGVTLTPSDPPSGLLAWFDAFLGHLRSLFGATCEEDPSQCDTGDAGGSWDFDG